MDILIDPYRFGPTGILNAPLLSNSVDIIAPAASVAEQGLLEFDGAGLTLRRQEFSFSPSKAVYTAAKIDPTGHTEKFTISVNIDILDVTTGGNGLLHRVVGISDGIDELAFAFEAVGSANMTVTPYVYDSGIITTIAGEPAPTNGSYRIEWTGTQTAKWYINGVLFYTYTAALERFAGDVYVSNSVYYLSERPRLKFNSLLVTRG